MRFFIVFAIMFTAVSANAYRFEFTIGDLLTTEKTMSAKMQKQFAQINAAYLTSRGMTARLIEVDKQGPTHHIRGEVAGGLLGGVPCTPSQIFYERVDYRSTYPTGVDPETIQGIGIIWPATMSSSDLGVGVDRNHFLIPACLK